MNIFLLGLKITDPAQIDEQTINVLAEALPSNDRRVNTKVQLLQNKDHYVGKLLQQLQKNESVLAIVPTRSIVELVNQFVVCEVERWREFLLRRIG